MGYPLDSGWDLTLCPALSHHRPKHQQKEDLPMACKTKPAKPAKKAPAKKK